MEYNQNSINHISDVMGIDASEIAKRKAYLDFDKNDLNQLNILTLHINEFENEILDNSYEHLLSFREFRTLISKKISLDKFKTSQKAFLKKLTCGHYESDYVSKRLRAGLTHQSIGLDIKWYAGLYRKYLSQTLKHLSTMSDYDSQQLFKAVDSLIKIIMFDMGLAVDSYVYGYTQTIKKLEQNLDNLIQGINGFIWEFDVIRYQYLYISMQTEAMTGYSRKKWFENPEFQRQIVHPDDFERSTLAFNKAIFEGEDQEIEYRLIIENGQSLWVKEKIHPIKDSDGKINLLSGIILDIGEHKKHEAQITYMATYDDLTGLPNRNFFERQLSNAVAHANRTGSYLAILFLDLDGCKSINDSLGHTAGDQLLKTIGQRIKETKRVEEFAARFGGNQFCIILENIIDNVAITKIANRCLKVLEQPTRIAGHDIYPRISVGITIYPTDAKTPEKLLQCGNNAMYAAKNEEKQHFAYYNQQMSVQAEQRLTLENDLRRAVLGGEFELYYQPQIALNSGKLVAVEALIRWHHPEHGIIPPDKFVPVAEEIGLMISMSEWVLNQACQQMAEWRRNSVPVARIAINISGSHFCDDMLPVLVTKTLKDTGLDTSDIELEITEGVMQSVGNSIDNFSRINELGINIAIDDFGTGYSCLSSLTELPIDSLKIDRVFIQNVLSDTSKSTIVATIIAMSRALGFSVVAEGVETFDQLNYLHGIGCDVVQGYFFSKPVPANQIPELTRTDFFKLTNEDQIE